MKWEHTKEMAESVRKLAALYAKYRRVDYDGDCPLLIYKEVKDEDLESAQKLLENVDKNAIVAELEENLGYDIKQNIAVFNIWHKLMNKSLCWLLVFSENGRLTFDHLPFIVKRQMNEPWTPDEFCQYFALLVIREIRSVQEGVGRLKEIYCFENDDKNRIAMPIRTKKNTHTFSDIIQYEDKDRLLKRLHELIDGKGGADVGSVILQAWLTNLITRKPTRREFESEFKTTGSWTAIYKYFDDNNQNALDRANRIVFFAE